jgi:hypothetical protein
MPLVCFGSDSPPSGVSADATHLLPTASTCATSAPSWWRNPTFRDSRVPARQTAASRIPPAASHHHAVDVGKAGVHGHAGGRAVNRLHVDGGAVDQDQIGLLAWRETVWST